MSFDSPEAARRFERRAIAAIRHATQVGLFTPRDASRMLDRVYAVTAATIAALIASARMSGDAG